MDIRTHDTIDSELCGKPVVLREGFSRIELPTIKRMEVDRSGLVHGGFIFGLGDYAAMLAVNHPECCSRRGKRVKFTKPVKVGETVVAEATVVREKGKKRDVSVTISRDADEVFQGDFTCFVLDKHVLE